jgi:hypothetical protein
VLLEQHKILKGGNISFLSQIVYKRSIGNTNQGQSRHARGSEKLESLARSHVHVGSGLERRRSIRGNGEIPTQHRDLIKDFITPHWRLKGLGIEKGVPPSQTQKVRCTGDQKVSPLWRRRVDGSVDSEETRVDGVGWWSAVVVIGVEGRVSQLVGVAVVGHIGDAFTTRRSRSRVSLANMFVELGLE